MILYNSDQGGRVQSPEERRRAGQGRHAHHGAGGPLRAAQEVRRARRGRNGGRSGNRWRGGGGDLAPALLRRGEPRAARQGSEAGGASPTRLR